MHISENPGNGVSGTEPTYSERGLRLSFFSQIVKIYGTINHRKSEYSDMTCYENIYGIHYANRQIFINRLICLTTEFQHKLPFN